jgi:ATP-dependent protease ClpP protease subunit
MRCFNHENGEAIGTCRHCNKALCKECGIDTGYGIACKGKCEKELKEVHEVIEFNKSRTKQFKKTSKYAQFVIYILVVFGVVFLLKYFDRIRNEKTDDINSTESLYDKTELGIVNTFWMDTVILETRRIYFNYDFNEYTCAWLIKLLWLLDSKSAEPIDLYICSSGGYISEAKAVGNTIHSLRSKVNTYATGGCASSALRAVAYGTGIRSAYCNTILMFHGDDFDDNKTERAYDAVAKEVELKDWQRISKITKEMLEDPSEFNMNPYKAKELGFIDTVLCP